MRWDAKLKRVLIFALCDQLGNSEKDFVSVKFFSSVFINLVSFAITGANVSFLAKIIFNRGFSMNEPKTFRHKR